MQMLDGIGCPDLDLEQRVRLVIGRSRGTTQTTRVKASDRQILRSRSSARIRPGYRARLKEQRPPDHRGRCDHAIGSQLACACVRSQ